MQHQIDRLHRAGGLLGQHGAEVGDLAPVAGDRLFAAVPNGQPGGDHDNADQDDPDEGEAVARSGPALGRVAVTHYRSFQMRKNRVKTAATLWG